LNFTLLANQMVKRLGSPTGKIWDVLSPFIDELRRSLPLVLVLLGLALVDFFFRVLPSTEPSSASEDSLDLPDVNNNIRLSNDQLQYYLLKINEFGKKPDNSIQSIEDEAADKQIQAPEETAIVDEFRLLGVFKDEVFFAVIHHSEAGKDSQMSKVQIGSEIRGFTVTSISKNEVTLVSEGDKVKVLRIFDINKSHKF